MNIRLLKAYISANKLDIDLENHLQVDKCKDPQHLIIFSVKYETEGDYEVSANLADRVLELCDNSPIICFAAKVMQLFCMVRQDPSRNLKDRFDKLDKEQEDIEKLRKDNSQASFNYHFFSAHYNTVKSTYVFYTSDYQKALEFNQRAINHWSKIDQQDGINLVMIDNQFCYNRTGEFDKAINCSGRLIEAIDPATDKITYCHAMMAIAETFEQMGNYRKAAEYFEQAYLTAIDLDMEVLVFHSSRFLARIQAKQGLFDKALELHEDALKYLEQTDNPHMISLVLNDLGITSRLKKSYNQAEKYHHKSIRNSQKLGIIDEILNAYYNLILLAILSKKELDVIREYQERVEELIPESQNPKFDVLKILCKALVLQYHPRLSTKFEATRLLKDLVKQKDLFYDYRLTSVYYLLDLQLLEYNYTKNREILAEIEDTLRILKEIGEQLNSYPVSIDYYMLRARFDLEQGQNKEVTLHLKKAHQIAKESGVEAMKNYISMEQDMFMEEIELMSHVIDDAPASEKKFSLFSNYLGQLQEGVPPTHQQKHGVDPIMFMIISPGGMNLFSKDFGSTMYSENNLIASFLSAMTSFTREAFDPNSDINLIRVGDRKLILQPMNDLIYCFIYRGYTSDAIEYLSQLTMEISKKEEITKTLSKSSITNSVKVDLNQIVEDIILN